jgi:hypothetical protein
VKIKRVNKITIELAPWEAEKILADIKNVIDVHQQGDPYPLGLHDFGKELKEAVDGQA